MVFNECGICWTADEPAVQHHTHTHRCESALCLYKHTHIPYICRIRNKLTHTNSPGGDSWHRHASKWLMWVFVTKRLRDCGKRHSSLTGVASTPSHPYLFTPTLALSLPVGGDQGIHLRGRILAVYVFIFQDCIAVRVCVSLFSWK